MNTLFAPRQWPLRTQVRVPVCLLIAALALGCGEWMARHDAALAQADAGESLLQTARNMADRLSQEMAARARDVQLLAELDVLRRIDDPVAARDALEKLRATLPAFAWIGMTDRAGTVVAATGDILLGQSIAARPVFRYGMQGLWTGDVHEAVLLARLVPHPPGEAIKFVDVAAPVRDPSGTVRGVLALHLSWQWADQLRQSVLRPRGAARTLQLMIVNAKGDMLLPPERGAPDITLPADRIGALGERWGTERWADGRYAITGVSESRSLGEFAGFGWRVVARDVDAARATSVQAARPAAYGWALALGAAAAVLACWVIGRLVAPVERLAHALRHHPPASVGGTTRSPRRNDVQQIAAAVARLQTTVRDRNDSLQELTDKAHRDPLTGLWNRAHLAQLTDRLAAATEPAETCALFIDLDGFKGVNDRYGHGAGDEVLVQVARRLRQAAREGDPVFRLGGDEFLILLSCPAGEALALARTVASRVLAELQRPLSYRTLSNLRINGSIGGAVWPLHGRTLDDTLAHADEALYAAKQGGRGQFRLYAGTTPPDATRPQAPVTA